jgi:hypothetical protein
MEGDSRVPELACAVGLPSMTGHHRKRPRDPLQLAKLIGDIATGQVEDRPPTPEEQGKNPAAVALGRLGGAKGGQARAQKLSTRRKKEIARKAARTRWAAKTKKD